MKSLVIGAAVFLAAIGSAGAQPPPPNYVPVPPPRQEFVPPPPGERMVWEPGHWRWDGFRYEWERGHYIERHEHHHRYVEGRWDWAPREGRYVWVPPHWD
jgi:hypothetical protein